MKIKRFIFNFLEVNCYVLWDETQEAVVIDACMSNPKEQRQFSEFVTENDLNIKHLLNTHLHFDHVLGNGFMLQNYNLQTEAGAEDEFMLMDANSEMLKMGLDICGHQPAPAKYLAQGDKVCFGNQELKILQVPGHSPGSLAFLCEADHCVFTGDALFKGSIGRTDLDRGSHADLLRSIREQLMTLPDETVVYPGHGPSTTIAYERQYNFYL